MARSRKKSSAQTASNSKAEAAPTSPAAAAEDLTASSDDETTETSAKDSAAKVTTAKDAAPSRRSAKDPVSKAAKGSKGSAGKDPSTVKGGEVTQKAKDSTRSTSVKKAAAAESSRSTGRRVAAATQNPSWLAPTAVVFLVLGLLYLVTYYISSGLLPLPIGDWNLAAGFGVLMVGGGMLMFWK